MKTNVFKYKTLPLYIHQFLKIFIIPILDSLNITGSKHDASINTILLKKNFSKNDTTIKDHNTNDDDNNVKTINNNDNIKIKSMKQ